MNRKLISIIFCIFFISVSISIFKYEPLDKINKFNINQKLENKNVIENSLDFSTRATKDWTFMVYLDGDNNLEEFAITDIDEMEKGGGTSDDTNVIVLIDRNPDYDSSNGNWDSSRYYEISDDSSDGIDSILLSDLGEVDMSHPDTLQDFIEFCFINYPADKYCLNLWDHGAGVFGACVDDTTGSDEILVLEEIQSAIEESTNNYNEYIDVLSFDCCVMNMIEVAYEMRNYCDYIVASEESIPLNGFNYQPIISTLNSNPNITPLDFCEVIVDCYEISYSTTESTCLSVIDTSQLNSIIPLIDYLARNLTFVIEEYNCFYSFYLSRGASRSFYDGPFVDLISFCENVKYYIDYDFILETTDNLLILLNKIVVYNWQHECYKGTANGLSIFLPITMYLISEETIYNYANGTGVYFSGMDWISNSEWCEFIRFLYDLNGFLPPANPLIITTGTETTTYSIKQLCRQEFMFKATEDSIFEIKLVISYGDVDLRVGSLVNNRIVIIGSSKFVNPDDSNDEIYQLFLKFGFHYLLINCNTQASYKILIQEADPISLKMNEEVTEYGYSINGDGLGHFIQDSNYYYSIDLEIDLYTFMLNNSELTNFQMDIYFQNWTLITMNIPTIIGENLVFVLNNTESQTFFIRIHNSQNIGYFALKVIGKSTGNQEMSMGLIISLAMIILIPMIICIKRNKKKN